MSDSSAAQELWERVRDLKPRLRTHAQTYHHTYRGVPWYVIRERQSARHFRLSEGAYDFVVSMDGKRSLDELWQATRERLGEDLCPGVEEILQLIGRLREADLLHIDRPADADELFSRWERQRRRQRWSILLRPLALRFPFLDPESMLNALTPMARPLFGTAGLLVWACTVTFAIALTAIHWPELAEHGASRMLDPVNLLLLALAYPVVKALHELGHGLAIKIRAGEVHEMGIMLIVLMPVPYVDASAASAFEAKSQRMAVGAAGVLVETFLAAIGIFVWLAVEPGMVRDLAFNVAVIGGVSTVLFNGNPLLRFDGYYVLADAVEIPNLGPRSTQYFAYLAKRYLLGLEQAQSPVTAPGERGWFLMYGSAAYAYRLFISFTIALFVADAFLVVGMVLAVWALSAQIIYPLGRQIAYLLADPAVTGQRVRGLGIVGSLLVLSGLTLHLVPVPSHTLAQGFIRLPEQSLVRAGGAGFIGSSLHLSGKRVSSGEPLFELEDPLLEVRIKVLSARIDELEADRVRSLLADRARAEILKQELAEASEELQQMQAQAERLVVRSPLDGVLLVPRAADLNGRFAQQGDLLAYVIDRSSEVVKVVVPQTEADLIRRRTLQVQARIAVNPSISYPGRVLRETPSASGRLPSRSLGTQGGGAIAVDASDDLGLTVIEPVFEFDVLLPSLPAELSFAGSRVLVKFVHDSEPLTRQWGRRLRQLFLSRLQI